MLLGDEEMQVHRVPLSPPPYQSPLSSPLASSNLKDPLLSKSSSSAIIKRKKLINGSLLPNFTIPTPYSRKNKILVSFTLLATVIIMFAIAAVMSLLLNRRAHFGGMVLYEYFFTVSGVVASYVVLMVFITTIMRIIAKFSKRFRYYVSPFAIPLYTCIWAALCFEFLPFIVPAIDHPSQPTRVLKECIRIAASCSIVSAAGIFLLIIVERIVYGELQARLWNVLWSERCVALVALEDNTHEEEDISQACRPDNVLSLAHVIQSGNHGLGCWLKLPEVEGKDEKILCDSAIAITNMIMERRDTTNRGRLYLSDINSIPDLKKRDAINLFKLFDANGTGSALREEIKNAIEVILMEKKYVMDNCKSRSLIIGVFHQIIRAILTTVIIVIILVILLEVNVYTLLVGLGTAFIGLGFALSTTIQGLLESLQMIFFVRPFDIGDIVRIDEGPPLQVEKVNIASTFFYTLDGYGIYYPNSKLARSCISNWKRSRDVTFDIPLHVCMEVSAEHIKTLRERIQEYMNVNQQNSPRFVLFVSDFGKTHMTITVKVTMRTIWQERQIWMRFASELRMFAITQVVSMEIQYQRSEIFKGFPDWAPARSDA